MSDATEAIERRIETYHRWRRTTRAPETAPAGVALGPRDWWSHRALVLDELASAETFAVAAPICDLLAATGPAFPPAPLSAEDAPVPCAWLWFARPLPLPAALLGDAARPPLRALTWRGVVVDAGHAGEVATSLETASGLSLAFYLDGPDGAPLLSGRAVWSFGATAASWRESVGAMARASGTPDAPLLALARQEATWHDLALRYLGALLAFLEQRILTTARTPIHHGATRKRLVRAGVADPAVQTIALRRREYTRETPASTASGRRYTVQWLVRGHWRRQWYPGRGEHRARWIAPYLKGDPDHPLRTPPRLYVVAR